MFEASRDYYKALEVDKRAAEREIRDRWTKWAADYRPSVEPAYNQMFIDRLHAFNVIGCPEVRKQYDHARRQLKSQKAATTPADEAAVLAQALPYTHGYGNCIPGFDILMTNKSYSMDAPGGIHVEYREQTRKVKHRSGPTDRQVNMDDFFCQATPATRVAWQ
ncbi:hypothetical protein PG988_016240 [Apiospora saccharicola]